MAGSVVPSVGVLSTRGAPKPPSGADPAFKLLIVVDQRAVFCNGLRLWLGALGAEFESMGVSDIGAALDGDLLARSSIVVFSTGAANPFADAWLHAQVGWLVGVRPDVPIVLIGDADYTAPDDMAAARLRLSGYIPASSTQELVAAALRLILAGGTYFPRSCHDDPSSMEPDHIHRGLMPGPQSAPKLSPRERAVLGLLKLGLPNKVIGHRLGMSPSTVKAHVHSIIGKLNVRNRTEAAVTRYEQADGYRELLPAVSQPQTGDCV